MKEFEINRDGHSAANLDPAEAGDWDSGAVSRPPPPRVQVGKKSLWALVRMLGWLVAGGACGYFGMRYGLELFAPVPGPKWLKILGLATLPILWLVAAGFHELGHVIGGWIGGGRFLLWLVGPVMVRRTPAGIRVGWNRSVNLCGGMAVCVPLDPRQVTPGRVAVMILGGPVASLLLTVGAFLLADWLAAMTPASTARALGQNLSLFTGAMSALIFLITVVPSAVGGFKTDGKRVVELLRGDHRSEQEAAMMVLTAASLAGMRPADYDQALVAKVLSLDDGWLFDRYGHLTIYYHAADRRDWLAAQKHLDHVVAGLDQIVPYVRDIVRCEYAWLLATQTRDATTARAWLDSAGKLDFDPATRFRAEAAVLLAEGKAAEAAAQAREGLNALEHRTLSPVKSPFAVDALEALLRRAEPRDVTPCGLS